jgi:hypothetical protein
LPPGRLRRLQRECPHCGTPIQSEAVLYWHDQRSRRRGALHRHCLEQIFGDDTLADWQDQGASLLYCDLDRVGMSGDADEAIIRLLDRHGEEIQCRPIRIGAGSRFEKILMAMTGRSVGDFFRERLFIDLLATPLREQLSDPGFQAFHTLRRMILHHQSSGETA